MRRFVVFAVTAVLAVLAGLPEPAAAGVDGPSPVVYRPPVDAPLTDRFRPPVDRYAAGNRGVDYGAPLGQPVVAAADGEVTFAGPVGGDRHVVILHADGIRTSYSFLATSDVRRGQSVAQGQVVGTAGAAGVHFGARAGDVYLDPLVLLGQRPGRVHLVADDESKPLAEAVERRRLVEGIGQRIRSRTDDGVRWLRDATTRAALAKVEFGRVVLDGLVDLAVPMPVHLAEAAARWEADQATCTPPGTPATRSDLGPDGRPGRRIVVLVGGQGSRTGDAAVLDVDTDGLGYEAGDVHQFSYRADGQAYGPADTQGDIAAAGDLLARHVGRLQRLHPGVPVDVIAHSQGGLVSRSAVTRHGATPAVLVTLASPHGGADLASAAAAIQGTRSGRLVLDGIGAVEPAGIDPNSTSILQMSETSPFLRDLHEHGRWPPPEVTRVASIGARGDPVVPAHQTRLDPPAASTVVTPHGELTWDDHARLPGSPEASQEIARALAGQRPTCRTLVSALWDEAVGRQTSNAHDAAGLTLAAGGLALDKRAKGVLRGR